MKFMLATLLLFTCKSAHSHDIPVTNKFSQECLFTIENDFKTTYCRVKFYGTDKFYCYKYTSVTNVAINCLYYDLLKDK